MARIKRGVTSHQKHQKLLEMTKGYRMTKNRLIKVAKEAKLHAGEYAFSGRKLKKRHFRSQWISRLNQSLQQMDLNYSRFINGLKKADIPLDRKMLSEMAIRDPQIFRIIVEKAKTSIN